MIFVGVLRFTSHTNEKYGYHEKYNTSIAVICLKTELGFHTQKIISTYSDTF